MAKKAATATIPEPSALVTSRIHTAMMELLEDGNPHTRNELHALCAPGSERETVQVHLSNIRKKIQRDGYTIACVFHQQKICYQLFRTLRSASDNRS